MEGKTEWETRDARENRMGNQRSYKKSTIVNLR